MSNYALELKDVTVSLRRQVVLDKVNLSLPHCHLLGLIGPNGAGKTVLLRTILGLVKPDSGSVSVLGVSPLKARGSVGYVPQYARFDADYPIRVRDVVLMGRLARQKLFSNYSAADLQKVEEVLTQVGMADTVDREIAKLSGGELQRVLIARALASEPALLLLDEPTASLDTRIGKSVYELLSELAKKISIILVSHDIGVIAAYVETVACLNRTLHYHHSKELSGDVLAEVYGCPVELIAHGHAHRVLGEHKE